MKSFRWSAEKNAVLVKDRGVSFEKIVIAIESGDLVDILAHPNPAKYSPQQIFVVAADGYI